MPGQASRPPSSAKADRPFAIADLPYAFLGEFRAFGCSACSLASADQIDLDPDGFSDALPGAIRRQCPHPEPRRERQTSAVAE